MSRLTVRKAVIPAAGLGTRFLPATKASPKEMLPLVDKPLIQYTVEEAVASGIEDIIVITGRGKHHRVQAAHVFLRVEIHLRRRGRLHRRDVARGRRILDGSQDRPGQQKAVVRPWAGTSPLEPAPLAPTNTPPAERGRRSHGRVNTAGHDNVSIPRHFDGSRRSFREALPHRHEDRCRDNRERRRSR